MRLSARLVRRRHLGPGMRFLIASFSFVALSCLMTQREQLLPEASGVILSGRAPVAGAKVWHEQTREAACSDPPPDETSVTDANGRFRLAGRKGSKVLVSSWGDAWYGWAFCLQAAAGRTFASSAGGFIGSPGAGTPSRVIYFCDLTINELRCVTSVASLGPLSFWRSGPRTYQFSDCESAAVDYCEYVVKPIWNKDRCVAEFRSRCVSTEDPHPPVGADGKTGHEGGNSLRERAAKQADEADVE